MKDCTKCNIEKPLRNFGKASKRKDGHHSWCKDCTKLAARTRYVYTTYGITTEDYDEMRESQGYACKLCGINETESSGKGLLHIDHCHRTGKVRGLLCSNCNTALGLLQDSPSLIIAAFNYINESIDN